MTTTLKIGIAAAVLTFGVLPGLFAFAVQHGLLNNPFTPF